MVPPFKKEETLAMRLDKDEIDLLRSGLAEWVDRLTPQMISPWQWASKTQPTSTPKSIA